MYQQFLGTAINVPDTRYLEMPFTGTGCRTYTMTFSLPVQHLVLPFADIDGNPDDTTVESIQLVTPGYVVLYQGSQLNETGSTYEAEEGNSAATNSTSPCTTVVGGTNCPSESGNLTVFYPGPLTAVSWTYCRSGGTTLTADLFAVSFRPC